MAGSAGEMIRGEKPGPAPCAHRVWCAQCHLSRAFRPCSVPKIPTQP